MTKSIGWALPLEHLQLAIKIQHGLEDDVTIWGCALDEQGGYLIIATELSDEDIEKIPEDGFYELDNWANQVQ